MPPVLSDRLAEVAQRRKLDPALHVREATWSYGEIAALAPLLARRAGPFPNRMALLLERDAPYYAAVHAIMMLGGTYVPLNLMWPRARLLEALASVSPDWLLFDAESLGRHEALLNHPSVSRSGILSVGHAGGWTIETLREPADRHGHPLSEPIMYIMLTSGSTGAPKAVPIPYRAVESYIDGLSALTPFGHDEVVLQAVELTFDLSVHDMTMAWTHGGLLVSAPAGAGGFAPRFIRRHGVTRCLLTPSMAAQARLGGQIDGRPMPSIRRSYFCGEALPGGLAAAWAEATPNAALYNLYGPTEATIAFSAARFDRDRHGALPAVPLGHPLGCQRMRLSDEGEIMLSGSQLSPGYLGDPDRTAERFPVIDGRRWYLTGDRGSFDKTEGYGFHGRIDDQIKLRGYRVELGDVEAHLRAASGCDHVAVAALPSDEPGGFDELVGFVCWMAEPLEVILTRLQDRLPPYMAPARLLLLKALPLNANGKVDRAALARLAAGRREERR